MVATRMKAGRAPRAANAWLSRVRSRALRQIHRFPMRCYRNPAGATLQEALAKLGVPSGTIAIIGGADVFSMFLPFYDVFQLTRAAFAQIPRGRPVFPSVGPRSTPEDALSGHGLKPGPRQDIDVAAGITLTTWTREWVAETRGA